MKDITSIVGSSFHLFGILIDKFVFILYSYVSQIL